MIKPHLYLGNAVHVRTQSNEFIDLRINVIINCCNEISYKLDESYLIKEFPIDDDALDDSFEKYLDEAVDFIHQHLLKNSNIYVHCVHGVSRSVSILIYYLMKHDRMSFDKAYRLILFAKPSISPHINFIKQLKKRDLYMEHKTGGFENIFSGV